ncbi:O-antigen ligase family protein [Mangrovibacterium diazotrophicum]
MKTGNANNKSIAQRIEYFQAAWTIWQKHFWFGVGTGNWKVAYKNTYQQMGSDMDESQYADAHNQYLAWLVRFGFIGTVIILFLFFWPVLRVQLSQFPLFGAFIFILVVSNMGDSNLDTHVGGYFFLLFYCLFLTHREYLKPGALRRKSN